MKVVILCGGFGTRIREVAENIPKPMIPIGDKPILWHIMKYYSHFGYNDFILCLGHKSEIIKNFFINYKMETLDFTLCMGTKESIVYHNDDHSDLDWRITFAETGLGAMTGARIKRVQKYLQNEECFLLTYGDGVGNINLNDLVSFHLAHGKLLSLTAVRPPGRFGELAHDSKGVVTEFNEKPQATGGRISGGFFVCRYEIFKYLDSSEDLVFEKGPLEAITRDRQLMAFEHNGFWQPMDTRRDFLLLNELVKSQKAPWVVW